MTALNQQDAPTYRAKAAVAVTSGAAIALGWIAVVHTVRGVWGILRYVIPGGV